MFPRIVIGDVTINVYSLNYLIAILLGLFVAYKECKRVNLPVYYFPPTAFFGIISGIIGAKIFEIIFYEWNDFVKAPISTLFSGGGWMYYGAEIVGVIGGVTYLLIKKLPVLKPLDIAAFAFMIAHSFGRLGCFFAGCCYGTPTNCFTGVIFPGQHIRVHPTQLYESIPLFLAFVFFWSMRKKFAVPGTIFASYIIYYGILRFFIEFLRYDAYTFGFLGLRPSQYIALFLFITGIIILVWQYYHGIIKTEIEQNEKNEYVG